MLRRGLTEKVEGITGNSVAAVGTAGGKTLTWWECAWRLPGADRRPMDGEPSESGGPERGQGQGRRGLRATVGTLDFT